jgi:DNA-directed RNA polymerase
LETQLRLDFQSEMVSDNLMARELELEEEGIKSGVTRYRELVRKATERGQETTTTAGQRLLKAVLQPMEAAVSEWVKEANSGRPGRRNSAAYALSQLDPAVVAFITAKSVLDSVSKSNTAAKSTVSIGGAIEDELRMTKFQKESGGMYTKISRDLRKKTSHYGYKRTVMNQAMNRHNITWTAWTDRERLLVGQVCLDLFIQSTGMVEMVLKNPEKNSTIYYIVATEETMRWINEENARCELMSPMFFPMLVPPKPWTSPYSGGYYSQNLRRHVKVIKSRSAAYLEELENRDLPVIYEALNTIQDTKWQINKAVLGVVQDVWASRADLGDLPKREDEEPPPCPFPKELKKKDMTDAQLEVFREWKRTANRVYDANIENRSKRLQASKIIYMAERFADEQAIYFPYNLDFRGRIYAIPMFLNPQGQDLAKALLQFGDGKPLGSQEAADWLAVHGANCYGYDKVSYRHRVEWVLEHEREILESAADPLATDFWSKGVDKPWQFLAFCFEWAGYKREGSAFTSRIPVALDGSCNGLQHYSAMLRDPIGAAAVNLVPADIPQDIYQRVADVAKDKLEAISADKLEVEGENRAEYAQKWLGFGIDRKLTKRSVMTLPYGSTHYSCREYIEDRLYEKLGVAAANELFDGKVFDATKFLATVVWQSIGEVVVAARQAMDWLQKVARIAADEGLPINWTTPVGLPVQQPYKETKAKRVTTKLSGQTIELRIREELDKVDRKRQANGIAPNFIHSLDGACLQMYVVKASREHGIRSFGLVHDSYATLAADTEASSMALREVFCDLYKADPLKNLLEELKPLLSKDKAKELPRMPQKGSLDLEVVKSSQFFFS